ncbi:MAG: 4-hydroxy-tetrahydrodipicolinate reductase [Victivallaceae bacterium]|nr:4-hydroxy-tetrahydrodipicolinate reductase [Victivallaceae bacterium]
MIKVAIVGAAGRMGRRLVANVMGAADMKLVGALEIPECPLIGQDAGTVAGCGEAGVRIVSDPSVAFAEAEAVINFSTSGIVPVTRAALAVGASAVIGTTALKAEERAELAEMAKKGGRIVQSPNMSVGVNLLFHLAAEAAKILDEKYDIEIVEMHHNQKKDAPSGTAEKLGQILCAARGLDYDSDVRHGRVGLVGVRTGHEIGMHSLRGGDVVGDHTVIFATGGERIELTHRASSRDTFVIGALRAVRFLSGVGAGLYDMQDVLGFK